jgi:hypothetical protein
MTVKLIYNLGIEHVNLHALSAYSFLYWVRIQRL